MQALIRRHMGSRSMSSIGSGDMQAVLSNNFKGVSSEMLSEMLSCYTLALNAMDQGVSL